MPTITIGGVASSYNATAAGNNYYDVPTNPKMTLGSYASGDKLYTIIYEDGTISNDEFKRGTGLGTILTEFSNLTITEGFTLRCKDNNTGEGTTFNPTGNNSLSNYEYYVLIHSDNHLMYHFAKITSVLTNDVAGDGFTFSPRMGNEIQKGVKFKIFKGPPVASLNKIVAISAGISKDIPLLNIAKPYFYFYDDKLDKEGELNHNTKYMLKSNISNDSTTYSGSSAIVVNTINHAFTTVADHRYKIIDYSKFTYNIKLEDKLKLLDDPDIATSNEGSLLAGTFTDTTDYNDCFINARRDVDDISSSLDLTGQTRYVHYTFSPEENNRMPSIYEINIIDSFDVKTGYASIKMIDSTKNLSNKVFNNDRLFVNQKLKEESFNEWVEVGTINALVNAGTRTYSLEGTVESPNLYFSATNEIKIGDRICIVNSVASTHNISLETHSRLATESIFTSATSLTSFSNGTKVYRKRLNPVDSTFFTSAKIPSDRLDKLNGIILSNQYKNFYCRMGNFITNADKDYGLLTINFENNLLDNETAFRYVFGELLLNYQVFFGFVEEINKKLENNQTTFEIEGRNTLSKMVDIIVNKDTLFSSDFISSAESPFNNVAEVGYASWTESSPSVTFDSAQTLVAGDHLWNRGGYIGEVQAGGTATGFVLVQDPSFKSGVAGNNVSRLIYKETNRNYVLGKALASNRYTNSVASLAGASDKGLYFKTGNKLTGNHSGQYSEGVKLVGLSQHDDINALGFNIQGVESILEDLPFQSVLSGLDTPMLNALIDFTILDVKENDNGKTVKLAPYMPLTLGREVENLSNFEYPFAGGISNKTSLIVALGSFGSYSNGSMLLGSNPQAIDISKIRTLKVGEPLFANNNFIGRYIGDDVTASSDGIDNVRIYVDRAVSLTSGDLIGYLNEYGNTVRSLHLINGGHLQNNRLIDLVSPTQNTNSPRLYNYDLNYTNNITQDPITSAFKYRNKPHKIFNLEKGVIGEKNYTLVNFISNNDITPFYADDAIFNYYADTYCAYPDMNSELHQNKYPKASLGVQLPIGMRGIRPITFSNFADKRYYLSHANNKFLFALNPQSKNSFLAQTGTSHAVFPNPLLVRDKLQQLDPRAARLFLYANRDKTFYSSRRRDSLLNSANSVSIENYGLFSSRKPKETTHSIAKDSVFGNTISLVNFDADYQHSSITSSNKTLSALKRFSIMRLTECVYDSFMNPINPEFDISGNASITASNIDMAKVHTSATQFAGTTYFSTSNQMTMNGAVNDIVQGDIIIDETNNKILGQVSGISGNNNQNIDFYGQLQFVAINDGSNSPHTANDPKLSGFSYVAGDNIKYIKYAEIARYVSIGGRLDDSILFKYGSDARSNNQPNYSPPNFHLLKGLIVNEDKLDAWGDYYIERTATDNIDSSSASGVDHMEQVRKTDNQDTGADAPQYDIQNIMLPYCFHGIFRQGSTSSPNLSLPHPSNPNYNNAAHADHLQNINIDEGFWTAHSGKHQTTDHLANWEYNKSAQKEIMSWDIFRWVDGLDFGNKGSKQDRQKINSFKIVALKTFGTEDTSKDSISSHIVSPFLSYASLGYVFRYQEANYTQHEGKSIVYPMLGTTIEAGTDMESDNKVSSAGIYIGMKFHVSITTAVNNALTTLSNNYKSYEIPMVNELIFLKMVDLTGCYLVPSTRGKRVENGSLETITSTNTSHNLTINDNELIYVVAHEYDLTSTSNGEVSILTTDKALTVGVQYKIMQPNPVCFWENSPKKIQLNTLTSAYTKKMDSDSMISDPPCWEDYQTSGDMTNHSSKEGVQSMYVIADLDKVSGSGDLVLRTSSHLSTILNVDTEMCLSDGDTNLLCHVKGVEGGILGNFLEMTEMRKLKGIVSATETFELEVKGDIDTDSERAVIGTTVAISKDVEDTVEELLRLNDIKHTFTKENYDLFNTTNFKGTNLFETINFLLNKKDKKLTYVEDAIKIVNFNSNEYVAQFSLSDDDITEINTVKSKFNYFNEVAVYGKMHKSVRKDLKQIKKNGRKTLEINEPKLTTKEDVDTLAQEKLLIHTRLQELIEVKVPLSKIHTLTVGETIILESKVAGLQPRPYIVLEKIQTFDGLVKLKLGEYLKGIEDILSNLLSETIKTQSHGRDGVFDINENMFDLLDNVNIKEIHLLVRKKESSGTHLGFQTTLNTNTTPIGFADGTLTFTTLVEEDL